MAIFRFDPQARLIRIAARVTGNTAKHIVLIVDTGASLTTITHEVAWDVGLDPSQASLLASVTTASEDDLAVPIVTVPRLEVLGHALDQVDTPCLDLPSDVHADGLLGLNFLRHFKLFINFPKGILVLQERTPRRWFHRLAQLVEVVKAHW